MNIVLIAFRSRYESLQNKGAFHRAVISSFLSVVFYLHGHGLFSIAAPPNAFERVDSPE